MVQATFIFCAFILGKYGSFSTRFLLKSWLIDEDIKIAINDVENDIAAKKIYEIQKSVQADETHVNNETLPEKVNWKYVLLGVGVIGVVVICTALYTETVHLESIVDLNFNSIHQLISTEFFELRNTLGSNMDRLNEMNTNNNTSIDSSLKMLSGKLSRIIDIISLPKYRKKEDSFGSKDLGDFSNLITS